MKKLVYHATTCISKILGFWFFDIVARIIATGYFLFFPKRVGCSVDFYRALFPDRGFLFHLSAAWRQYQNFTNVFIQRSELFSNRTITYRSAGWRHLEKANKKKEGGIILMSHVGNWEMAAHLLKEKSPDLKMMLYLGVKHKEQIEKLQKQSLAANGTKIIAVEKGGGSPFLLLESLNWLNSGGFVSLTGDIIWTEEQKTVTVNFSGKKADLPETPFMLALISQKPLFVMFSMFNRKHELQISVSEPIYVTARERAGRKDAVQAAAQLYADILYNTVTQYPFQWFHFDRFIKC